MSSRQAVVGALELGGTHVTAARVNVAAKRVEPGSLQRRDLPESDRADDLLAMIGEALRSAMTPELRAWGVAVPGPFDYTGGICTIAGVAKLEALYGVDMRHAFAAIVRSEPEAIRFLNDADAFLLGEWWAGAAKGHATAMGITLGTGLGSAFMRDGTLREDGPGVPKDARLDLLPFRGAPVEDVISARGLLAAYRRAGHDAANVEVVANRAYVGDDGAAEVFRAFGSALGVFLAPVVEQFAPSCLVFGGSISRSWSLFADAFTAACRPLGRVARVGVAMHLEEAPLLGAARHAITG